MFYDPIIPFRLTARSAEDIRRIKRDFGFRRFIIGAFNMGLPSYELPPLEAFEEFARSVNSLKRQLDDPEIELDWWCTPTLGYALGSNYQRVVNFNGGESRECACPLDAKFRHDIISRVAAAVAIAQFPILQFEDDFELSNHPGVTFGCFCPLHLAELEKRTGTKLCREELVKMYQENRPDTLPLRGIFNQLRRESLELLADEIRQAVDKVSPSTRISLCEPGTSDYDGDISATLPAHLAGKNLQPLIRLQGSNYCSTDSPQTLPWQLAHAMFSAERLPAEWEKMHESDTYPHSRFFMSESYLRALMTHAFFFGMTNSLLYACQYLDDPAEDQGYLAMARDNREFFRELIRCCQTGHLDGVRIYHHTDSTSMPRLAPGGTVWLGDSCYPLGRLGIPYSTRHGSPVVLSGAEAQTLENDEIRALLSGSLLLDATAAEILDQRGFAEDIGVKIKRLNGYSFYTEILADIPEFSHIRGRMIYNNAVCPVATEASQYRNLIPLAGTEVLSHLADNANQKIQPAMCRFINRRGGRIAVLCHAFAGNISSNLLCYRKKEMLRILVEWLRQSPLPAFVEKAPNVWLLVRDTEEHRILAVTALTCSHLQEIEIALDSPISGEIRELQRDGTWSKASMRLSGNRFFIPQLEPLMTRIFLLAKSEKRQ